MTDPVTLKAALKHTAPLARAALSSRSMAQAERKPKRAGKGKQIWI
jgi:hypothetical protein